MVIEKRSERRQYPRFMVGGRTRGRVTTYDASLLDISLGGALVEHAQIVRPGTLSYLVLPLQGHQLSLRCRVARSLVHRPEPQPDGERMLIYHTGLEFVEPSDETLTVISEYIDSLKGH